MKTISPVLYKTQSGVVLVVSMIMLLLLTLVGISSMQNSGLEEKMAGNMRDSNIAFQAAESALVAGERAVALAKPVITCPAATGYYNSLDASCDGKDGETPVWNAIDWSASAHPLKTLEYSDPGEDFTGLSAMPRYIIEQMDLVCRDSSGARVIVTPCAPPNTTYRSYRITAVGTGGTQSAQVMLQSIFEVPS
jgi:type IV pilus assembly protein PilX